MRLYSAGERFEICAATAAAFVFIVALGPLFASVEGAIAAVVIGNVYGGAIGRVMAKRALARRKATR